MSDDLIDVWFEGDIKISKKDIAEFADGDFIQAVQNELGGMGAQIEDASDMNDNKTLAQHEGEDN